MQEQVGWTVLTQALAGGSLLGLGWSSSLLSDGPRPGAPLPRRFTQVAASWNCQVGLSSCELSADLLKCPSNMAAGFFQRK